MCRICVEYQKANLTWGDAWRNAQELSYDDPHYAEIVSLLINEMDDYPDTDRMD